MQYVTLSAAEFASIAALTVAAAPRSERAPILRAVRIDAGPVVTAWATDRYMLARLTLGADRDVQGKPFSLVVDVDSLVAAAKTVKSYGKYPPELTLHADGAIHLGNGAIVPLTLVTGNFPPLERLLPEASDGPRDVVPPMLSAKRLAMLARLTLPTDKNEPAWRVQLGEHGTGRENYRPPALFDRSEGVNALAVMIQPVSVQR